MPRLEVDDGRFLRLGDRRAPDLLIDAASIAAIESRDDGYAVHLAGGQTLQLAAAAAGELLKKLGREKVGGVSGQEKPKPESAPPAKVRTAKPRRRRSAAKARAPAPSFGASVGRYLSRLFD